MALMSQREALEVVLSQRGNRIVVTTMSSAGIWPLLSQSPLETLLIAGARHAPHFEAKDTTLAAIARFVRANLTEHRT